MSSPIDHNRETIRQQIIEDFKCVVKSREMSLLGRKEVLTGKAKFGIFGDGKELAQIAMAKVFRNGDFRSGYYRDQTFMLSSGLLTVDAFFAQLYAHPSQEHEPVSAGRMMNGHYGTRLLDNQGKFLQLSKLKNVSADISPTAGQMPRLLGLAQASKYYREQPSADEKQHFSRLGNEIAFGTIGNASTSEGLFFETINAAGVLQVPMVISVWDDQYGISVPAKYQTTKESISEILEGFRKGNADATGYEIFKVKGWDYPALVETYEKAEHIARERHTPVLIHVEEMTQPQGHSTSGSHERYKSKERLQWEEAYDCIEKFSEFIVQHQFLSKEEIEEIRKECIQEVKEGKQRAWSAFNQEIQEEKVSAISILRPLSSSADFQKHLDSLEADKQLGRKEVYSTARSLARKEKLNSPELAQWMKGQQEDMYDKFSSELYHWDALDAVEYIAPSYSDSAKRVDGRVILKENFDHILATNPEVMIFGEDAGNIGDVNQGLEGLQAKHGEHRVSDTGIREATIIGQGIGMAMRGLRPIAEIQYLDYLLYAIQILSDDTATLRYRTKAGQKSPLIVRTRGHRLEGIWHSGSPMGMILNALRGMLILTPRNMTIAAGFYNTLLQQDNPALLIECLNGYRLKEALPENIGEYTLPFGVVEILKEGTDITIVSYGSTLRLVMEAAEILESEQISCEVIDAQTLIPFDRSKQITQSLSKTNRLAIIDEDVPGGASAYILQEVLEKQNGYKLLDSAPLTLSAQEHRPAYGTDGDYFSKPSIEDIVEKLYGMMHEANPVKYPEYIVW